MDKEKSAFSRNIWLTVSLFFALIITFGLYIFAEKKVDRANNLHNQALLLADELRQSSDDLTYMARNFVVSGNPLYKQYYQDILDIRDGKKPRPQDYQNFYWKLVLANKRTPHFSDKPGVSLLELMRRVGLAAEEFNKLAQAKANSDLLVVAERRSMQLVDSISMNPAERAIAIDMLFDDRYNQAKAVTMQAIGEFYVLLDKRMDAVILAAKNTAETVRLLLIGFGIALMLMLWRTSQSLQRILGGTLDSVYAHIIKIGGGDFSSEIPVHTSLKDSVLGWLAQTQENLREAQAVHAQTEASLRESEARYRRIVLTSEEGIWTIDADAKTSFVNPKMAALLGYTENEMIGAPVTDFMDDTGKLLAETKINRRRQGIAEQHDFKLLHKDGSERWFKLASSPIFDVNNQYAGSLAMATDITTRRQTESALQEAYLYTQAILDNMADGVITFNALGDMESFNTSAHTIFGYSFDELMGGNLAMLIVEDYDRYIDDGLNQIVASEATQLEVRGKRKDGSMFPISLSISTLSRAGRITYVGVIRDITLERAHIEEVHRLAFYDPLTALPNRRLLSDRLAQSVLTASRTGQHGALMFLDLDHFKQLNDTLGHDIGDELLQQVAMRLQSCVRDCDTVARMGGDEFVVLLETLSTHPIDAASQAEVIAHKILNSLGQPYRLYEHSYVSTPSIGVVVFLDQVENTEDLFKKADVAMYQAKAMGRNAIRFFDPAMQAALAVRIEQEASMRRALVQNEFILHYQIQVDAHGVPTGVEALVRWEHSVHGIISPAAFIPMAEETGMIIPIGKWVLESACKQLLEWASHLVMTKWSIAVNISASQFSRSDFVEMIKSILAKSGANPARLKLEVTESMLVSDVDDVVLKMMEIKQLGVTFSLDDFGTGYSSLAYLKRFPLEQLKIDQSFVHNIISNNDHEAIARTVVTLGHNLGLKVVAEGVETIEERNFLSQIGCDAYQGYYFGRPVATQDLQGVVENLPRSARF